MRKHPDRKGKIPASSACESRKPQSCVEGRTTYVLELEDSFMRGVFWVFAFAGGFFPMLLPAGTRVSGESCGASKPRSTHTTRANAVSCADLEKAAEQVKDKVLLSVGSAVTANDLAEYRLAPDNIQVCNPSSFRSGNSGFPFLGCLNEQLGRFCSAAAVGNHSSCLADLGSSIFSIRRLDVRVYGSAVGWVYRNSL